MGGIALKALDGEEDREKMGLIRQDYRRKKAGTGGAEQKIGTRNIPSKKGRKGRPCPGVFRT